MALCQKCGNTENVNSGQIQITGTYLSMSIYWFLCVSCFKAGWRPPVTLQKGSTKATYHNINNGEKHDYALQRPIPDPIME